MPEGVYTITAIKSFPEGNFVENTSNLTVTEDTKIDSLFLPKSVIMHQVEDITDESVNLSWSPTDASDFREYKIYRHITSGLDETTGLLIHVSTSINDTVFNHENLDPLYTFPLCWSARSRHTRYSCESGTAIPSTNCISKDGNHWIRSLYGQCVHR